MGSEVAEAQIDDLSDAEIDVLLEMYEALRLAFGNGRKLVPAGNMYVWDHKGISLTSSCSTRSARLRCFAWTASPSEIAGSPEPLAREVPEAAD